MSDYEGGWEPASSRVNPYPAVPVTPNPDNFYIVPRGTSHLEAQKARAHRPLRQRRLEFSNLSPNYRPALQGLRPGAGPIRNGGPKAPIQPSSKHLNEQVLHLPAYVRYKNSKDKPDSVYEMVHPRKDIERALRKHREKQTLEVFIDKMAEVCLTTNAFVEIPQPDSHVLKIWGSDEQVYRARQQLHTWEMHVKGPGKKKTDYAAWTKQNAFDGREEDRLMRQQLNNYQRETFQQAADESVFLFKAVLLWPDGYDLENFVTEYDDSVLASLEQEFQCQIAHIREGVRFTRILTLDRPSLLQVYTRIARLNKEMVTRKRRGLHTTQCRLPPAMNYQERVGLKQVTVEDSRTVNLPYLTGPPLQQSEEEAWNQLASMLNKKYRLATKTALRSCINSLHLSQKHTRMRVEFGDICMLKYKRPADAQDTYHIDDFITMVQLPEVESVVRPLHQGAGIGSPAFRTIDQIESLAEFENPEISWAVHFDFRSGTDEHNLLRLEIEFTASFIDPDEASVSATRWLNYNRVSVQDVTDLLELHCIDFKRVGYRIHLEAAPLFKNVKVLNDLRSFERGVSYKPSMNGLKFEPAKHSTFPHGNNDLRAVREITTASYRFRRTKGTFEIRRVDVFPRKNNEARAVPQRTEWFAAYYYQDWDRMLAELANIQPGQDVDWRRDMSTFFPKSIDEDYLQSLPHGFKDFMKEVDEIQTLLARALGREPSASINGVNGKNGVNGHGDEVKQQ